MRPVAFGEALAAGTRLTLFSDDKLDRFFTAAISGWPSTQNPKSADHAVPRSVSAS